MFRSCQSNARLSEIRIGQERLQGMCLSERQKLAECILIAVLTPEGHLAWRGGHADTVKSSPNNLGAVLLPIRHRSPRSELLSEPRSLRYHFMLADRGQERPISCQHVTWRKVQKAAAITQLTDVQRTSGQSSRGSEGSILDLFLVHPWRWEGIRGTCLACRRRLDRVELVLGASSCPKVS